MTFAPASGKTQASAPAVPSWLDAENFSAMGAEPVIVLDAREYPPAGTQAVMIGVDAAGTLDCAGAAHYDVLLTSADPAPAPWMSVSRLAPQAEAERLAQAIRANPVAATTLCRLLRVTEALPFDDALFCESLAYSTLLGGAEFRAWLQRRGEASPSGSLEEPPVKMEREGNHVTITLAHAASGNAMSAPMRDALFEALCAVLDDPSRPNVTIRGDGRCFSTGGALSEFGTAQDLAMAHAVRTLRSGARLIHALGKRADIYVGGAAIGSGLEVAAAAGTLRAAEKAWLQLPELAMGLIPGAGGTVTLPRVIGRHRTAWLAISGRRISAAEACKIGLVSAIGAE